MSDWSIDPAQVGSVLSETAAHIGEEGGTSGLLGHMSQLETRITSLNSHINSAPIGIAIGEFAEHHFGALGGMLSLTASAVQGASEATTAYVEGDREMAAEAQASAGEIPDPEAPPPPPPAGPGAGRPV
ncbi:DUF6507 family protein [Nocardiopsis sp. MG754419]|uniref:DUF6507 family protein n=1 Tax=Nocardiopsis sp. MG754419 TaxID=2259865 RepID=UPI001BAD1633|nr:DUF6507 family protein [Nocardiopsis sp. MG754419]MBR8744870.1 hypothetical protein [Nocardiopsis sp. MG754419]